MEEIKGGIWEKSDSLKEDTVASFVFFLAFPAWPIFDTTISLFQFNVQCCCSGKVGQQPGSSVTVDTCSGTQNGGVGQLVLSPVSRSTSTSYNHQASWPTQTPAGGAAVIVLSTFFLFARFFLLSCVSSTVRTRTIQIQECRKVFCPFHPIPFPRKKCTHLIVGFIFHTSANNKC